MLIEQIRIDLIDLYTTIHLLRGLGKDSAAPFSFLTAKRTYNGTYSKAVVTPVPVTTPQLQLEVHPICKKSDNNFWNGASNRRYEGYAGMPLFSEVAWNKFLPFVVAMPVTIAPTVVNPQITWTDITPRIYVWSCGWGLDIKLTAQGKLTLKEFASIMLNLKTEIFAFRLGTISKTGTITTLLKSLADEIQHQIFEPIAASLQFPVPEPVRYGPFSLIAPQIGSGGETDIAKLDEESQRLIYAVTSSDSAWQTFSLQKIRESFKGIDNYPGSFIFYGSHGPVPLVSSSDKIATRLSSAKK